MLEITGNMWDLPSTYALCVLTNGVVTPFGENVMGAGVAKEARERWPDFPKMVGHSILVGGNHVHAYVLGTREIFTFPTKNRWTEKSTVDLVRRSTFELVDACNEFLITSYVALPRPGCGYGGLLWEDVEPVIKDILDDRFHVITF